VRDHQHVRLLHDLRPDGTVPAQYHVCSEGPRGEVGGNEVVEAEEPEELLVQHRLGIEAVCQACGHRPPPPEFARAKTNAGRGGFPSGPIRPLKQVGHLEASFQIPPGQGVGEGVVADPFVVLVRTDDLRDVEPAVPSSPRA
jgi:hypothetical protein